MSFRPLKYIKNFQYFYEGNKNQKTSVCVIHLKLLQNRISSVFSRNSSSMSVVIKAFNYFTINIRRLRFRPQIFRNLIEKKPREWKDCFSRKLEYLVVSSLPNLPRYASIIGVSCELIDLSKFAKIRE